MRRRSEKLLFGDTRNQAAARLSSFVLSLFALGPEIRRTWPAVTRTSQFECKGLRYQN